MNENDAEAFERCLLEEAVFRWEGDRPGQRLQRRSWETSSSSSRSSSKGDCHDRGADRHTPRSWFRSSFKVSSIMGLEWVSLPNLIMSTSKSNPSHLHCSKIKEYLKEVITVLRLCACFALLFCTFLSCAHDHAHFSWQLQPAKNSKDLYHVSLRASINVHNWTKSL